MQRRVSSAGERERQRQRQSFACQRFPWLVETFLDVRQRIQVHVFARQYRSNSKRERERKVEGKKKYIYIKIRKMNTTG